MFYSTSKFDKKESRTEFIYSIKLLTLITSYSHIKQ